MNPKLLTYIDFIYFTTMQILQLNQSNLLLKPLYVHKLQFISNKLHPSSSPHSQLRELVFLSFLKRHTKLVVELYYRQSDLSSSVFQSNNNCHEKRHTRLVVELYYRQSDLSSSIFQSNNTCHEKRHTRLVVELYYRQSDLSSSIFQSNNNCHEIRVS